MSYLDKEVYVYKGDDPIAAGTIKECATKLNIKARTLYYYLMPAYKRKVARRTRPGSGVDIITVVAV